MEAAAREPGRAPLLRLLDYARPHRRTMALATACSVLNKVLDLAPPLLIGAGVDVVVRREHSAMAALGLTDPFHQLVALGAVTLVVFALESAFQYAYQWLWRNLAQTIQHELRLDAYAHIQRLDLAYIEDRGTGGVLAVLNDDINQLERFLDGGANDLLQVATTVVVIGAVFFYLSPEVAWVAMAPMPFILWGSFRFQRLLAPRYRAVRERHGLLNEQLSNNLAGLATIKSFTTEAYEVERVREGSEAYREANRRAIALSSAFSPLIRMVIVLGFLGILTLGGWLVLEGRLEVGAYSVLAFMTQRLLWPLTRLGQTFDLYQRGMASAARALNVLREPVTIADGDAALPREAVRGALRFDDVRFSYHDRAPVLRGLAIEIPAGATAAVVGATGAGKTTLVKLLLRLHDPTGGRVLLDDRDVRTLRLHDLRGAIGLVSQDVFLFHGTVRENIAYGSPDAAMDAIREAAERAEAHAFIDALPDGYDTIVGERGQKLSGGQRQRLAIARALLKDPPVLVLDEATSSVDNETEAAIQRSLARIVAGRTTLIIAHRLSTVRDADRIFVLDQGRVTEQGTHEALLARDGLYAALWRVQTGERAAAG